MKDTQEKLSTHMQDVLDSLKTKGLTCNLTTKIITSPGKFESLPYYLPFFYDCTMDHWDHIEETTESGDNPIYWLKLEHEDYINLTIPSKYKFVGIIESDNGFISYLYK